VQTPLSNQGMAKQLHNPILQDLNISLQQQGINTNPIIGQFGGAINAVADSVANNAVQQHVSPNNKMKLRILRNTQLK